jgi:hypothetical protein
MWFGRLSVVGVALLASIACSKVGTITPVDADHDGWLGDEDCDETNPAIHAGAPEVCDGADDDCDGATDETGSAGFVDVDGDGFGGLAAAPDCAGVDPGDCDDDAPAVNPDQAEIPDDGVDQDCTGADSVTCFADADGDGFGDGADLAEGACPSGSVAVGDDCADDDATVFPGAHEVPNDGIDQDCDGADAIVCYEDRDGDGFGTTEVASSGDSCGADATVGGDCEDGDAAINPAATEIPDDGIDQDCDGTSAASCYVDEDDDRYGTSVVTRIDPTGACDGAGEAPKPGDCADDDPLIGPGNWDYCDGGVDDDCDPSTPDGGLAVGTQYFQLLPDAIAAANRGDTVLACAGTYGDAISITKDLTLRGVDGAASTTLDVTGLGAPAIIVKNAAFTLEGFTVTYGEGTPDRSGVRRGGGLFVSTADDVNVTGCVFQENYTDEGGGIWFQPTSGAPTLTITDTVLWFEHAVGGRGGAIYTAGAVVMDGGSVSTNEAAEGGGVYVDVGGSFAANAVDFGTGGDANTPDDVASPGGSWTYGAAATFACDETTCVP